MSNAIPQSEWIWYGNAGHFIGGRDCVFHLTTKVGKYLVSTVGEYYPKRLDKDSDDPESLTNSCKYETMVFEINGECKCGCGLPNHSGESITAECCNTPKEANEIHLRLCHEVANYE